MAIEHSQKVKHLHWRAGMGLTTVELAEREKLTIDQLVDRLFLEAKEHAPLGVEHSLVTREQYRAMKKPEQSALLRANRAETGQLNVVWMRQLAKTEGCLREKMAFFWHDHFACWTHWSASAEQYLEVLRANALGNFGTLLKAVSKSPAMLEYLNNRQNRKNAPNENFAREVMELFTLGRGHYSETDIHEAARAFTGWTFEPGTIEFQFRAQWHDDGVKHFRGSTGNFDGDDILDRILADPQCAHFICDKLYRFLVHPEPDASFVTAMSDRFFHSGHDIGDLLRFVFTSEHFHLEHNIGARIKSPVELLCGLDKQFHLQFADDRWLLYLQRSFGQVLLHPPSVAGWTKDRGWIDSNALMARLKLPSALLNNGELEWEDPASSPEEMDRGMADDADQPLRDARGRRINVTVDREGWLAGSHPEDAGDLYAVLLSCDPSPALRSAMPATDAWERTLVVLSSPEYQLC